MRIRTALIFVAVAILMALAAVVPSAHADDTPVEPDAVVTEEIDGPRVDVKYTCIFRSYDPNKAMAQITASFADNPNVQVWAFELGGAGAAHGGRTDGPGPISFELPALPVGRYPWQGAYSLKPLTGALMSGSFAVTDSCAGPEPYPAGRKVVEGKGECQKFTLTNIGEVATGGSMIGVSVTISGGVPSIVDLAPGQSRSFDLQVNDVVFVTSGTFQITGMADYTAVLCLPEGFNPSASVELQCVADSPGLYTIKSFIPNVPMGYTGRLNAANEKGLPMEVRVGDTTPHTNFTLSIDGMKVGWDVDRTNGVLIVCPPASPEPTIPTPAAVLPETGANSWVLTIGAALLVGFGAFLLRISRQPATV